MKKCFAILGAAVAVMLASYGADATTLSLSTTTPKVHGGDAVLVDLTVSGLGDGAAPSLGTFDVDILFDPGVLSFTGTTLGGFLGDELLGEALDLSLGETAPGTVDVAELSLLFDFELDLLQPDSFVLATLEFSALNANTVTTIEIDALDPFLILGDGFGIEIPVDTLTSVDIAVAEPASLALFGFGLAGFGFLRRRSRRASTAR